MIRQILIFLVTFSAVLCCAIPARQNTPATAASKSGVNEDEPDLVVVKVDGLPVTEKQVVAAIDQLANQKRMTLDQRKQRNAVLFQDAIEELIRVALIKNQARLQNITVDTAKVDEQLQQISKQFPSRDDFLKAIEAQGITETDLRKNIEESLGIQEVLNQVTRDVPATTEEEISKFYNDNPDKFMMPERVHAAHILLRTDPKNTSEENMEIKKKLEQIRAEIESKAITFADAAAKYSQDPSNAQKGGDLGFFTRGQMVKPIEEAAFTTIPGTLSPIVKTQFGYHLIQVIETRIAGKLPLEEAKPAISKHLNQIAKQNAAKKYIDALKAKAEIETYMTQEEFVKRHPAN